MKPDITRLVCFREQGGLESITFWCWWEGKSLRVASSSALRMASIGKIARYTMHVKRLSTCARESILSRVYP